MSQLRLGATRTADLLRVIRQHPATWAAATTTSGTPLLRAVAEELMRLERVEEGDDAGLGGLDQARNRKYVAVRTEKAAAVAHELVRAGADVDTMFRTKTPMQLALSHKRTRCVRRLLELGADPNRPHKDEKYDRYIQIGTPPLHTAVRCSDGISEAHIVRELLAFGAEVDGRNSDGETALKWAASHLWRYRATWWNAAIIAELILAGADPHARAIKRVWTADYYMRNYKFKPGLGAVLSTQVRRITERNERYRRELAAALARLAVRCGQFDLAEGKYVDAIVLFTGDNPARVQVLERYVATL